VKAKASVLIIDDEKAIRRLLRLVLTEHGYAVLEADSGQTGLTEAAARRPDAIILDLGLPDGDGHTVLQRLREWSKCPVLILTVRDDAEEKVRGLDAGADDYITKPFDTAELLARLRAILRRTSEHADAPVLINGPLAVDFRARQVRVCGTEVSLTATEYALLRVLAVHAGRVVTHRQLLREVWGPNAENRSQYLRVYVTHLRKKLERPAGMPLIKTEPGIGYRLVAASA
jgi:two-component system, OmpR family, KDP operon response regulator KdpE